MLQENNFQEIQVFESPDLNKICDLITNKIFEITGSKPLLIGSVSKLMSGNLPEDYQIKDIDFAVFKNEFRMLQYRKNEILQGALMTEITPRRIIIYLPAFAIEIWNANDKDPVIELFKNKIPYIKCQ